MPTVVLGVTGCIGAYKACDLLRELQGHDVEVRVVMTEHATRFVTPMTMEALSQHEVFTDQFLLGGQSEIQHVTLADMADLLLIAPCTANVLGKLARGIADDALTTLYLATKAPVVLAPAMNVNMFEHPAVVENLGILRKRGVSIVEPGSGYLACGWLGKGRLADVSAIVTATLAHLSPRRDMSGLRVLVTAGPTIEDIDPVRFISNRSSGRMGFRLAEAARDRGAEVVLVCGPTMLPPPAGVDLVRVRSAVEMAQAVSERASSVSAIAMAAAVADYRPAEVSPSKLKKRDEILRLELVKTHDILKTLGEYKGERFLIGFAAETERLVENARTKLAAKHLDLIVANDLTQEGVGFEEDTNAAILLDAAGGQEEVPLVSKRELADRVWNKFAELRNRTVKMKAVSPDQKPKA
jgi:phosphopantothenoylcysteine decarboxylase/phosphopantothenate--cysteine ligase